MSTRVLATDEAKQAIAQIQSILTGDFLSSIQKLDSQGSTLCDPNVWDGQLASQFRHDLWPQCKTALDNTHSSLEELHTQLSKITTNIMQAGGNA